MSELTWAFDDVNSTQDALRKKFKKTGKWKAEEKIPFSSDRKYRAAFLKNMEDMLLGAPEFLVPENTQLMERVNQYSAEGMRVLLLASATLKAEEMKLEEVKPLGLIIIEDQIRPEAKDTFAYFREQKVAIKVLSGDNPVTVSQIAGKAGLEGADKYLDARNLPEDFEELRGSCGKVCGVWPCASRTEAEHYQGPARQMEKLPEWWGMVSMMSWH